MRIPTVGTLTRKQEQQLIAFAIHQLVQQALNGAQVLPRPQQGGVRKHSAAARAKISAAMQRRWKGGKAETAGKSFANPLDPVVPGKRRKFATPEEAALAKRTREAERRRLSRAAAKRKAK